MEWFFRSVIKYRRPIMIIFMVVMAFSAWLYPKVIVDYDVMNYMPQDSRSMKSIRVMKKEFGGQIPNTQIMIRDVDQKEAMDFKKKLEAVNGVLSVQWVDSMLPSSLPLEILPDSTVKNYYKDGNALFIVTVDEDKQLETVPELYDLIGEKNAMTGTAVITVVATVNTVREIAKITIIAILFVLFVLIITTTSWAEPFIIMFGLLVAIVINSGTNIVFHKISFVTNSAGLVLQLALSMDYAVFLIHRYTECKEDAEPEDAMLQALMLSSSSILSSGLTTVIGFIALATMRFLLGADLGLALSKGVAISLITALVFMPGVILASDKLIEKTRHRRFLPSFRKFGVFVTRVTIPLMIIFVILIVPSFIGSRNNKFWYGGSNIYGPDTRVGADREKLSEAFGYNDTYVLMVPRGNNQAEHAMIRELKKTANVKSVMSPISSISPVLPAEALPDSLIKQLRSDNYDRVVLSVSVPQESEETFILVGDIHKTAEKYFRDKYYLVGMGPSFYDLKEVVTGDMLKVNLIAIVSIFLVLLLTMQNLVLPVILVLVIETAIWINMSISLVMGSHLFYIVYLINSSIQLGATVDYAILFTQRYRENRRTLGIAPRDCIVTTVSDTTVSIMTSAFSVSFMGMLLYIFSSQGMIAQLGLLLGRGTMCSLFAVLFVLPGMLMTFDKYVNKSFKLFAPKDIQFKEGM